MLKRQFITLIRTRSQPEVGIILSEGKPIEKVSFNISEYGCVTSHLITLTLFILWRNTSHCWGFIFKNKSYFPIKARIQLVQALFLSMIDYGDLLYMHATSTVLKRLDPLYPSTLHFISDAKSLTHHCTLNQLVGWSPFTNFILFVYKALLGKLPHLTNLLSFNETVSRHDLHGGCFLNYNKSAFSYCAPEVWNTIQS